MIYLDMRHTKEAVALGGIALVGLAAYEGIKLVEANRHQESELDYDEVPEQTIVDLESLSSGNSGFVATNVSGEIVLVG